MRGVTLLENGVEDNTRKSSIESVSSENSLGLRGQPSSKSLLVKMANDYSQYLKTDISFQITKVEEFVEESIAKLEDFKSLFEMKENERTSWCMHILPDVIRTGRLLSITLHQRLDSLACLILTISIALDGLEKEVVGAESKLGVHSPTTTIRSVFKYFKGAKAEENQNNSSGNEATGKQTMTYEQIKANADDPLQLSQFFH